MVPSQDDYFQIGTAIADETLERVRGRHQPYCVFDRPQDRYFVSSLAPQAEAEDGEFTESKPNNIGLKIQPANGTDTLDVEVSFEVYYPSFPTRDEYEAWYEDADEDVDISDFTAETNFFRRRSVELNTTLDLDRLDNEVTRVTDELEREIADTTDAFEADHVLIVERDTDDLNSDDLEDEETFDRVRTVFDERQTAPPRWSVQFNYKQRREDLVLTLANLTDAEEDRETEPYIFNPKIAVDGRLEAYELQLIPEDFRYGRRIWGKGQNCSVEVPDGREPDDDVGSTRVETTAAPSYQSYRFKPNKEFDDATDLGRLANPDEYMDALQVIESGMAKYLAEWRGPRAREREDELDDEAFEQFLNSADDFEQELENFRSGISVLDEVEDAERSFLLMNQAFERQDSEVENWYLFQIVFIVSNLGGIVEREYPRVSAPRSDEAEVLWFPTGGGKTEAYLGLIVFALMFDRIRGKDAGVTAWIRFPLRLLGKQQKDRFLSILHEAEELRQDELDGSGERFSIGYFVGGRDTPNSIHEDGRNNFHRTFQEDHGTLRAQCRVVTECPACGGEVDVRFEPDLNSVFHDCQNDACDMENLPLYVTDHDIYRNVPSVLLGTLDKISITGANPRFTNLLGNFTDNCPKHGLGYAGKCSESSTLDCDRELEPVEETLYDPIPTLHLVDEVHLLNEELGVFAGQYETLYQELCRQASPDNHEPKVLTSTATITEYEEHMWNLFLKKGNRFPEEGPTLDESFYGSVDYDDPERRYIGITPVNKTHIYSVLDLVKQYHQTVRDFRDKDPAEFGLEQDEYDDILTMYELSVVYFLKKTEKDRYLRSISNQINREMENDGYGDPIRTDQLTADIESTSRLDELEDPESPFEDRADTVAATSFIGHGIDVDRFNTMVFYGFPSQTFQYIQSSARVGRKRPGTVIDMFRPYDERDKHRYRYFEKTHEYLRRSIEAVSIDRWSKYSLEKTFAGVFKALLIQHYRPLMHRKYGVNVQSSRQLQDVIDDPASYPEFDRDTYSDLIRRSYGLHIESNDYFDNRIEEKMENYWEYWVKRIRSEYYTTIKGEAMRSLRDIGEQVEIGVDRDYEDFYTALVEGDD